MPLYRLHTALATATQRDARALELTAWDNGFIATGEDARLTEQAMRQGLELLGIAAPERR